jgi:hypothetical protein
MHFADKRRLENTARQTAFAHAISLRPAIDLGFFGTLTVIYDSCDFGGMRLAFLLIIGTSE